MDEKVIKRLEGIRRRLHFETNRVLPVVGAELAIGLPRYSDFVRSLVDDEEIAKTGARFALAGYGFAVAWTGRRLLRVALDDEGRWTPCRT